MALPILESSKYETIVPSTKKRIEFRPFLVKEEKILFIAQESKDSNQIMRAIKEIVKACTFGKIDVDSLAVYDLEHLFLQLRAKSVGEIIEIQTKCKHCESINPTTVNLDEVKTVYPSEEIDSNIKLTESIGIIAKPISIKDIGKVSDKPEDFSKMIGLCIQSIYDDDKVYDTSDVSEKELNTFVESLSRKQVEKIEKFISNQPKVSHNISFSCASCKKTNDITLEGLADFFN